MKKILCVFLVFCLLLSLCAITASAAVDKETRAYYRITTGVDKGLLYTYESFVRFNNLLPDKTKYTPELDKDFMSQYNAYIDAELKNIYQRNLNFYQENFTSSEDELLCCSEVLDCIIVYTTEEKVELLKLYNDIYYYKYGSTKEYALQKIENNKSQFYNEHSYTPEPYELLYTMDLYENESEPRDFRFDEYDHIYKLRYTHYPESASDGTATPDYALVFGGLNMMSPAYSAGEFGDYLFQEYNIYYPYILGHHIITLEDGKVWTLREAYDSQLKGIMDVFEDYGLGYRRGDANFDGKLNIKDATYIQKCLVELEKFDDRDYVAGFGEKDHYGSYVSDFNKDDKRDIRDVTDIQKYIAGIALDEPA